MGEEGGFGTRPYGLSVVMVDFWDSPLGCDFCASEGRGGLERLFY